MAFDPATQVMGNGVSARHETDEIIDQARGAYDHAAKRLKALQEELARWQEVYLALGRAVEHLDGPHSGDGISDETARIQRGEVKF